MDFIERVNTPSIQGCAQDHSDIECCKADGQ